MRSHRQLQSRRRHMRLSGYDYRASGAYFVTICTAGSQPLFGAVHEDRVILNELGRIADDCWKTIGHIRSGIAVDTHIVMPNHIHGVLLFSPATDSTNSSTARTLAAGSLGAIVGQYKSFVTKRSQFMPTPPAPPIWQRNYYDHIIRSAASLEIIRKYIVENPARWMDDVLYIS